MTGTLYLVPSTLGDSALDRVLPDAVCEIVAALDYYIVENAKSARAFLKQVNARTPLIRPIQMIEMRELNISTAESSWPGLLEPLLQGRDGGVVSEAGCPAVADPGAGMVALAHTLGITVRPLVGPSSILLALMASGLNGQQFAFEGYLPTDPIRRRETIGRLETRSRALNQTQIMIETPYRNAVLMAALTEQLTPATRLCLACDLTTHAESIRTRTIGQWRATHIALERRPTIFLFQA